MPRYISWMFRNQGRTILPFVPIESMAARLVIVNKTAPHEGSYDLFWLERGQSGHP